MGLTREGLFKMPKKTLNIPKWMPAPCRALIRAYRDHKLKLYNREYGAMYRKKHYDKFYASVIRWKRANREKVLAYCREAYRKNRKKEAARKKKYNALHPEIRSRAKALRRCREINAQTGDLKLIARWEKSWRTKKHAVCYWCKKRKRTSRCATDHILPLARGGPHSIENLCISCGSCNSAKNAKSLEAWNTKIEQPVLL
jgi:hypothetical protein